MGEEGEPAEHDPRPEDATRDSEQQELEQGISKEGEIRQVGGRGHRASLTRMILKTPQTLVQSGGSAGFNGESPCAATPAGQPAHEDHKAYIAGLGTTAVLIASVLT